MLIIDDKIISADVLQEQFLCNLNACKGACCWEGDYGAPLEEQEIRILEDIYPNIKQLLSPEGRKVVEEKGVYEYNKEAEENGTTLLENGACAFMTKNALGIAQCGIEQAYKEGITDFKKPISCHLYPIRIEQNKDFDAVNYDTWDICSAACELGKKESLPVFKFLKEALIRKYGEDFYEELEAGAAQYKHWSE